MPRTCTVCLHPERNAIDEALVARVSRTEIATKYKVGASAVQRHRSNCLSPALFAVAAKREERGAERIVDRLDRVVAKVEAQIDAAEEAGQSVQMLAAAREFRSGLELLARLTGELDERPNVTVNVLASPEVAALASALLSALLPFPEARVAAAAVLDVVPE
jgi:hypothetical protein